MTFFPEKMRTLIGRLKYGTDNGSILWSSVPRDFAFRAEVATTQIVIASVDNDGDPPFELFLMRENDVLESVNSTQDTQLQGYLDDLYLSVRRSVSGAGKILDDLLNDLDPAPDEPPF